MEDDIMDDIQIKPYSNNDFDKVLALSINQEQALFSGTAKAYLEDTTEGIDHKVIFVNQDVVGVFKIDRQYSREYEFSTATSLGLRALFIDQKHQGKGYGVASMKALKGQLKRDYPQFNCLYLTVNCMNPAARSCYLKADFIDNGHLYLGGAAGPQHIMHLSF